MPPYSTGQPGTDNQYTYSVQMTGVPPAWRRGSLRPILLNQDRHRRPLGKHRAPLPHHHAAGAAALARAKTVSADHVQAALPEVA